MNKLDGQRSRYLQDAISVRLGGLAANMARIASLAKHPGHHEVVSDILIESKWFIEWTAQELEIIKAAELVKLQIQLALWDLESQQYWHDETWRNMLAENAKQWSQRILEMSGLLPPIANDPDGKE